MSAHTHKTLKRWAYAAGHIESELDAASSKMHAAIRAEVLAEAADFIDSSGTGFPVAVRNGVGWAVRTLRRMADDGPVPAGEQDETTTKGKDTGDATQAPAGESTQPATVEFSDGTVTLSGWDIVELAPDYYGHTFMQIGGWLPEGWEPGSISHGTNHMIRADLPGAIPHAHNVNVQIEVKGYGGPRRYMKIQWRHTYDPAKDHRRTGGDA